jgi:hypothetical protein
MGEMTGNDIEGRFAIVLCDVSAGLELSYQALGVSHSEISTSKSNEVSSRQLSTVIVQLLISSCPEFFPDPVPIVSSKEMNVKIVSNCRYVPSIMH